MQFDCRKAEDGTPVIHLAGRLDFTRRDEFTGVLEAFLAGAPGAEVRVDCSLIDYLDSSGLGMLLVLRDRAHRLGCRVVLADCSEAARQILDTVQFGRLFRIT
jgi:anti-anti-sigma factor